MDDFIYIIALIAWVAFAFYRKTQKKNEAAKEVQRRAQSPEEPASFPTFEEILYGKDSIPEKEPVPVPVPVSFTTDGIPPVLKETAFEREYNRRGIYSIEEMDKPFTLKKPQLADIQDDKILLEESKMEDWRTKVDLRQAVIYSEILNRPYV
jgi:hypothetical protein